MFSKDKSVYLQDIDKAFPGFLLQREALLEGFRRKKRANERFNGRQVMKRYPELKGKSLGLALGDFRNYVEHTLQKEFNSYLLETDIEEIWNSFEILLHSTHTRNTSMQ